MKTIFDRLYNAIAAEAAEEARHYKQPALRFSASKIANCPWALWYDLSGYRPAPDNVASKLYKWQGEADQDLLRQLLAHYNIPIEGIEHRDGKVIETLSANKTFSVPMPGGPVDVTVAARIDGIIKTPRGRAIFEFKSLGGYKHKYLNRAFMRGDDAALNYLISNYRSFHWQMLTCMALFDLPLAVLAPKDRSTCTPWFERDGLHDGIYVPFDPTLWQQILQRCAAIQRLVTKGTSPDRKQRELDGSKTCNYCPFYYLCHGADKRGAAGLDPIVEYPGPQMELYDNG